MLTVNGLAATESNHKQAYVMQEDVFYSQLTVLEVSGPATRGVRVWKLPMVTCARLHLGSRSFHGRVVHGHPLANTARAGTESSGFAGPLNLAHGEGCVPPVTQFHQLLPCEGRPVWEPVAMVLMTILVASSPTR